MNNKITTFDSRRTKMAFQNLKPKKIVHNEFWKKSQVINQAFNSDYTMRRFNTMLFKGSSGIALKYLLKQPLSEDEQNNIEVNIAKEILNDNSTSKAIVGKISLILNKFKKKEDKPEDMKNLAVAKSQFRELFYQAKKEYEEKVEE